MNKSKALKKLKELSWEELDWLEQQCRKHKSNAKGFRVYSNRGDSAHRNEAAKLLSNYFEDVFYKHHGV